MGHSLFSYIWVLMWCKHEVLSHCGAILLLTWQFYEKGAYLVGDTPFSGGGAYLARKVYPSNNDRGEPGFIRTFCPIVIKHAKWLKAVYLLFVVLALRSSCPSSLLISLMLAVPTPTWSSWQSASLSGRLTSPLVCNWRQWKWRTLRGRGQETHPCRE